MKISHAIIVIVGLLLTACSAGGNVTKSDSVAIVVAEDESVNPLPDTAFASASTIKAIITAVDSTIPGTVDFASDLYAGAPGVFTFRGGQRRDASFGGTVGSNPRDLTIDWIFHTDEDYTKSSHGMWGGGTGWTGQPLIVDWPDSCARRIRAADFATPSFSGHEVIFGSLCGRVYFLDYATGKPSRPSIDVTNPIKGTVSLDPTLNGNLYVGQGVESRGKIKDLVIDLYTNSITDSTGRDPKALRGWTAWDSSALRVGDFLFRPGENGILYKYTVSRGRRHLHSTLNYLTDGIAPGMESSISAYRNYGFVADNRGNLIAINLDNLRPVWRYKFPDDVDATPVVAEEGDSVFIYAGCEVEHANTSHAVFAKIDALTGREIWSNRTEATRVNVDDKHFDGGYYATALPGSGNCSNLIFCNVVKNTNNRNGAFTAFDRRNGATVYSTPLSYYAWSSPVGFLNPDGRMFVVTADCSGRVYLIDGADGRIIASKKIGANFESSPAVAGNSLIVGSRGNAIYKISITE